MLRPGYGDLRMGTHFASLGFPGEDSKEEVYSSEAKAANRAVEIWEVV